MNKLTNDILEVYYGDRSKKIKNMALYSFCCCNLIQSFLGNEKSLKFSLIASLATGALAMFENFICKISIFDYEISKRRLNDVTQELILLGYDLEDNAMLDSTAYSDGLIEYCDKYDNKYFIYESIENNKIKYYSLISDDIEECLNDDGMHQDITKVIEKGLNRSKQNK